MRPRPSRLPGGGASSSGRGARGAQVRRHNLATILTHLHLASAASRSQLATMTGLNRSTIGDLVEELVELGLAEQTGAATGPGPGRPSPIVRPRTDAAVALAVDLEPDSFAIASVGLGGTVLAEERIVHPRKPVSPHAVITELVRVAAPLLDLQLPGSLAGVGVSVAGLTRRTDGFVHLAPNLGWRDVPLAALLTEALGDRLGETTPVLVANEADLGALGEHRRGAGRGTDDLVFVSGEVGIGVGIITAGSPLLGVAGYAGEAGHMLVNPEGRICGCGARGCWETEAGEVALLRRAGVAADAYGPAAIEEVMARAADGDAAASNALAESGWWLGLGVGTLVNLFNPSLVVLGGLYHRLLPTFEHSLLAGLSARALAPAEGVVEVVRSELGDSAPLLGAAELAFEHLLADPAGVTARPLGP